MNERETITVALSGGVDSAVSALRLREAGYPVEAVFMKNWEEDDEEHCAAADDLADAERVCRQLGIRLRAVNFAAEYWDRVFERFLAEHRRGLTPNPDVWCNREIKFRELTAFVDDLGGDRIATGHYARIERNRDRWRLLAAADPGKDQTYFLYTLGQADLERTCFPVGRLRKAQVRRLARSAGLPIHDKPGSTGICFIGERPFRQFLARYLPREPGPVLADDGRVLGEHQGLAFYTLGQRQGLGIGGVAEGDGRPWYVIGKEPASNTLLVGQGRDHPRLLSTALEAREVSWVSGEPPEQPLECLGKTRYRQRAAPCRVHPGPGRRARVEFAAPQWAVTPGQSVVWYAGAECLGGGIIAAGE